MSSDESENEESECRQGVNRLSERSKELYFRAYEEFMKWKESNCSMEPFSENIFMDYFREMAKSRKPTTLWSIYSMLKATISLKHDIHMSTCKNLLIFLKSISKGHQSKKSKTLTFQNIDRFLTEAPDYSYLALKVAMIVGVDGACRGNELLNISVEDIQKHSDRLLLVTLNSTKSKRSFVVCNERVKYVEKYMALRPADVKTNRFFLHYLNGKCTRQVIGKNKIGSMPREIASYLKLPNPELYTGHCFRRTSAALSIMTDPNRKPLENELTREVFIEDPLRHDIKMEVVTCAVDPWTSSVLRPSTSQEADLNECRTSPAPTEISMLNHSVVIKRETESDSEVITDSQENKYTEGVLDVKKENNSELIVVASLIDKLPNLGGMARTSEVFGVKTYVVDSLRHLQDKQFQSLSVSAERWIDVEEVRPGQALKQYLIAKKSEGYCVVAAEQTSTSVKLQNFQFPMKTLLLLGHEKEGIPCDLLPIMDYCVEIPQQGFVRSLNVHVTAAIFIWEYARQNIL